MKWIDGEEVINSYGSIVQRNKTVMSASITSGTVRYFRIKRDRSKWELEVITPLNRDVFLFKSRKAAMLAAEDWKPEWDKDHSWRSELATVYGGDHRGGGNGGWMNYPASWLREIDKHMPTLACKAAIGKAEFDLANALEAEKLAGIKAAEARSKASEAKSRLAVLIRESGGSEWTCEYCKETLPIEFACPNCDFPEEKK